MAIRHNKDYTKVLFYSYYTTITGRGGGSSEGLGFKVEGLGFYAFRGR